MRDADEPHVGDELEDARWFSAEEIAAARRRKGEDAVRGLLLSPPISIARWLIEHWYEGSTAQQQTVGRRLRPRRTYT